ncbi:LysR substrate-binding domain-containing protein [Pseudoalteromonas sp. BDTF-M6]|uniref:LysR substrate-binding domain-containing protein n=1 Tax=Pseudoalteromonas sp. BDTF-M6 TaxID=2796132 RepID=UPI001BAF462F|nr:LysR substrate-binding domain-containing protein [Pseudoalteromonas sp. BDTF-M6]MBS3797646.1 LysR family transcriptional regulator [Pseudoalteromonas sp. BDTF-M6]
MNIALRQLRVFVAVAQELSITTAANKLCLSKPAISMALSELEKQLGQQLFDRHNNRLLINEQGRRLLPLADELLARTRDIEHLFNQQGAITGKLNIGASDTLGNQVAPFLLRDFRATSGHLEQALYISNTAKICQKLCEFELDIGMVEGRVQHDELHSIPWLGDEMVVACHPQHPLAQLSAPTLADLEQQHWLLREPGSGTREYFLNHLGARLSQWQLAFELNSTSAIINSTAAGLGITCLSRRALSQAEQLERVSILDLPITFTRDYWLLYHKEKYQSPLLKQFIGFCENWSGQ